MMAGMQNEIHQQLLQEIEKLTKEKKTSSKEHGKELAAKNTKINNLLTEFENTKTDLSWTNSQLEKIKVQK